MKFIIKRFSKKLLYAIQGLMACWRLEEAFRLEVIIVPWLIIAAIVIKVALAVKMILIMSVMLLLVVELINTSIEKAVDLISKQLSPLAKIIKDVASAAVFIALLNIIIMWGIVLYKL